MLGSLELRREQRFSQLSVYLPFVGERQGIARVHVLEKIRRHDGLSTAHSLSQVRKRHDPTRFTFGRESQYLRQEANRCVQDVETVYNRKIYPFELQDRARLFNNLRFVARYLLTTTLTL